MKKSKSNVRAFISSTFSDMQEERDYLTKKIFPKLRNVCRQRGASFAEIDLRWGITEEKQNQVIDVCLNEVDRCRPFFIGLIGSRYGTSIKELGYISNEKIIIEDEDISITELEIKYGILTNKEEKSNALFYITDKELLDEKDICRKDKQDNLKEMIKNNGFQYRIYKTLEELGEYVYEDMLKILDKTLPKNNELSELELMRKAQEDFIAPKMDNYMKRQKSIDRLDNFINDEFRQVMIVIGEQGEGKTSLLYHWGHEYNKMNKEEVIIEFYYYENVDIIKRIIIEISNKYNLDVSKFDEENLKYCFQQIKNEKIIIIIDSFKELNNNINLIKSLIENLYVNIKLIIALNSEDSHLVIEIFKEKNLSYERLNIELLDNDEIESMIKNYLHNYGKELPSDYIANLKTNSLCKNPTFLKTILEEIRIFGNNEMLNEKLNYYLISISISQLFEKCLNRWEQDFDEELVKNILGALWVSENGLEEVILNNLSEELGYNRMELSSLLITLDDKLTTFNGKIHISSSFLKNAIKNKYYSEINKFRNKLVEYLLKSSDKEIKMTELPYQLDRLTINQNKYGQINFNSIKEPRLDKFILENVLELKKYNLYKYINKYDSELFNGINDKLELLHKKIKVKKIRNADAKLEELMIADLYEGLGKGYMRDFNVSHSLISKSLKIKERIFGKLDIETLKVAHIFANVYSEHYKYQYSENILQDIYKNLPEEYLDFKIEVGLSLMKVKKEMKKKHDLENIGLKVHKLYILKFESQHIETKKFIYLLIFNFNIAEGKIFENNSSICQELNELITVKVRQACDKNSLSKKTLLELETIIKIYGYFNKSALEKIENIIKYSKKDFGIEEYCIIFEKFLQLNIELYGKRNYNIYSILKENIDHLITINKYDRAMGLSYEMLEIFNDYSQYKNPYDLIEIYSNIGYIHFKKGDFADSENFYKKIIDIVKDSNTAELVNYKSMAIPRLLYAVAMLGCVYKEENKFREFYKLYQEVCSVNEYVYKGDFLNITEMLKINIELNREKFIDDIFGNKKLMYTCLYVANKEYGINSINSIDISMLYTEYLYATHNTTNYIKIEKIIRRNLHISKSTLGENDLKNIILLKKLNEILDKRTHSSLVIDKDKPKMYDEIIDNYFEIIEIAEHHYSKESDYVIKMRIRVSEHIFSIMHLTGRGLKKFDINDSLKMFEYILNSTLNEKFKAVAYYYLGKIKEKEDDLFGAERMYTEAMNRAREPMEIGATINDIEQALIKVKIHNRENSNIKYDSLDIETLNEILSPLKKKKNYKEAIKVIYQIMEFKKLELDSDTFETFALLDDQFEYDKDREFDKKDLYIVESDLRLLKGILGNLKEISEMYLKDRNLKEADKSCEKIFYFYEKLELDVSDELKEYRAKIFVSQGKYKNAKDGFNLLLNDAINAENYINISRSYQSLAKIYLLEKDYVNAEEKFKQALDILQQADKRTIGFSEGLILWDQGDMYIEQNKLEEAEKSYKEGFVKIYFYYKRNNYLQISQAYSRRVAKLLHCRGEYTIEKIILDSIGK